MQNPQRSFSGRRTTGTKADTLPRTARSWIFLIIIRAHPAGKLGEGATAVTGAELCERLFQSTPPARGGDGGQLLLAGDGSGISIHAPREGGDYGKDFAELEAVAQKWQEAFDAAEQRVIMKTESTFTEGTEYERKGRAGKEAYGRGEGEGRTTGRGEDQTVRGEFSPSSERYGEVSADFGEKPYRAWVNGNTVTPAPGTVSYDAQISIHAPLAGGRHPIVELLPTIVPISIHAPREGGDPDLYVQRPDGGHFNPRPPRGGRLSVDTTFRSRVDFNSRPPRGGRHLYVYLPRTPQTFQSTPPARGRLQCLVDQLPQLGFQSTPPARGATNANLMGNPIFLISIHAPREGGDRFLPTIQPFCW